MEVYFTAKYAKDAKKIKDLFAADKR